MYQRISLRKKIFQRLSWVSQWTFDEMIQIVSEYRKNQAEKRTGKEQCGRNHILSLEDQILLCLLYLRTYTTYLFLWSIFGISEASAWRIHREIETVLIRSGKFSLPKRTILQEELEEVLIDATESQIERPSKGQRKFYSGKKKKHTIKTQVVRSKEGQILRIHTTNGKVHDKKLYDTTKLHIHGKTKKRVDSGYQGIQTKESSVIIPKKAKKFQSLTKDEKRENTEKSKLRIPVEHTIARMKRFKIFSHPYRNRRKRFSLRMNLICGILNYELQFSQKAP